MDFLLHQRPQTKEAAACAAAFLKHHRMHPDQIDPEAELEKFMNEMDFVRNGGKGSVKMIPTRIGLFSSPAGPQTVTAIDIGGSHVRCAAVRVNVDGGVQIGAPVSFPTPGIIAPVDTAAFFGEVVRGVKEYLPVSDSIGICFSLATMPAGDRDAIMVAGGKQLQITDMMGKKVGECFRSAMEKEGLSVSAPITVINDTVAAALAGQAEASACSFRSFIGFIFGTGTNLCYREGGALINVESGAYCGFPTGDLDDLYDLGMIDRGGDRFEKMVSGGYQGGLAQVIIQSAASEGLITAGTCRRLLPGLNASARPSPAAAREAVLTSADLSRFCSDPFGTGLIADACADEFEKRFLASLFDTLTQRSARLCAITIAGAMQRAAKGTGGPFLITAEGSTYQKQKGFKEMLDAELAKLIRSRSCFSYEIQTVSDAIVKGLAVACLSG